MLCISLNLLDKRQNGLLLLIIVQRKDIDKGYLCSFGPPSNFKRKLRVDFEGDVKCFHRMCQCATAKTNII